MTNPLTLANGFLSPRAKLGALLQHVSETGTAPHELNAATQQVWEAMIFLQLVWDGSTQAGLSKGGRALLDLANKGEF